MRRRQPLRHIIEEGREFGVNADSAIGILHCVERLGPALLGDRQPAAPARRQAVDRRRNHLAEYSRSLAAAKNQQADRADAFRRLIATVPQPGEGRAHRHAGSHQLVLDPARQAGNGVESGRDPPGALGEQPVGAAKNGILLVDDRW